MKLPRPTFDIEPIRIFGVLGIVGFTLFSWILFDRTVQPPPADAQPVDQASGEEVAEEDGPPPEFLSFVGEFESGEYRVGDPADKSVRRKDKDVKQFKSDIKKSGRTPLSELPEIDPGIYTTDFDVEDCSYTLSAVHRDRKERDIGSDEVNQGRLIVTIEELEPDRFTADEACGSWSRWSPLANQLTSAGNGDYWTGDLAPGLWEVPQGCFWEKVLAFRGSRVSDVADSGIGPAPLRVSRTTPGVRIRGCSEPITFVSS